MVPRTYKQAIEHALWHDAISEEIPALVQKMTWSLVPISQAQNGIGYKWGFLIQTQRQWFNR